MALTFDEFAKDVLDVLLSKHGRVETEVEAPALTSQRSDVLFEPDPAYDALRLSLGLLGLMTMVCCLFEPFHEAPSLADVVACLRKLLNHRHARSLPRRVAAERSWLLCAGRPDRALAVLRMQPSAEWPRGFYDLGAGLPLVVVVLSELDATADTLGLRLLGTGATLRRALEDLAATPPGEVRDALVQLVVERHIHRRARGVATESAEEDEVMKQLPFVEELKRQSRVEGRVEGAMIALTRVVGRRLHRELSAAELSGLRERFERLGDRAIDDAVDLDAGALEAWLAPRGD